MIKRISVLCGLAVGLSVCGAVQAQTTTSGGVAVALREAPQAQEAAIIRDIYPEFLRRNPTTRIQTALVDLNGDGIAEIAARFVGPATCADDRCHTVVLMSQASIWRVVFERRTTGLALLPPPRAAAGQMRDIVASGSERWTWGAMRYLPQMQSLGRLVTGERPAVAGVINSARPALASSLSLDAAGNHRPGDLPIQWTQVEMDLRGARGMLVTANTFDYCSPMLGCPTVILVMRGRDWVPAGLLSASGPIAVMATQTAGMADLAIPAAEGVTFFQWNGSEYRASATTFPSPITRTP